MKICRTYVDLNLSIDSFKEQNQIIAFVPTMGALHDGHLSLIKLAKEQADIVVCSIFVNPTQFGEGEDLATYPRQEQQDCDLLVNAHVDIAYIPHAEEIYPQDEPLQEPLITHGDVLEGEFRPHFFKGVGVVVTKLLQHVRPDLAIFGEKDYQQLTIITNMVKNLGLPVEIIGAPTIREKDGLAMSSRNAYLSIDERNIAPILYQILQQSAQKYQDTGDVEQIITQGKQEILNAGFKSVDYLAIRDDKTLDENVECQARVLVAAWLGSTRLIDNI